jgi:hypothetical protein
MVGYKQQNQEPAAKGASRQLHEAVLLLLEGKISPLIHTGYLGWAEQLLSRRTVSYTLYIAQTGH